MTLSDLKIRKLAAKAKPYKTADFDGLYLLVNPNGSKLWRFKYRIEGVEGLLSFGKYPAISLVQAGRARDEARKLVAQGISPSEVRQNAKAIKLDLSCPFPLKLSH